MKVAITGCGHGELDKMYETLSFLEEKESTKIDLLICCGDFQSCRNEEDLSCMACPSKYKDMRTFYKYYSGEKRAPVLTIFIGGNHEASNYLLELFHGGWVAPNIFYMGMAGIVNVGGLRMGGLSGIFKAHDFRKGHFECPPFTGREGESAMRSIYHIREFDVFRLLQSTKPLDIFLSHDWPTGVYHEGDTADLLRKKKFLKDEVQRNDLGSPPARKLLDVLQPKYWFSAHLHVKFAALVRHKEADGVTETGETTRFLALDKCLPNRDYMQIIDFPEYPGQLETGKPVTLSYDEEWLAIMRNTNHLLTTTRQLVAMPTPNENQRFDFRPTEGELQFIRECLLKAKKAANDNTTHDDDADADDNFFLPIPKNFVMTVDPHNPNMRQQRQPVIYNENPQTTELLSMLQMEDLITKAFGPKPTSNSKNSNTTESKTGINPEEIDLDNF